MKHLTGFQLNTLRLVLHCPSYDYSDCGGLLRGIFMEAIAEYDSGNQGRVLKSIRELTRDLMLYRGDPQPELALLHDARSNLWRFADDLPQAGAAVKRWLSANPFSPLRGIAGERLRFFGRTLTLPLASLGRAGSLPASTRFEL